MCNKNDEIKMSDKVDEFIKLLENSANEYYTNFNTEHELFNARMDMIHTLELDNLSYHQVAHLGLDIRDICRTRRIYKNAYIIREPIMKFVKDNSKFLDELKKLRDELIKIESYMENMHYNSRQKVEGVEKLVKDGSLENTNKEDLICLNKIIKKFSNKFESKIEKYSNEKDKLCEIFIKIWIPECQSNSINQLINKTSKIRSDIDKFFGNQYENKNSSIMISDMLSYDEFNNPKLDSKIIVNSNNDDIYSIRIRTYGTIKSEQQKKKNRSRSRKRR